MKAAYKQFGVNVEGSQQAEDSDQSWARRGQGTTMFLPCLSVPRAVWLLSCEWRPALAFIGTKSLLLCWSSFFDDFTAVAPERLAENTQFYVEALFRLLGIDYASEGEKAPPFGKVFRSLGLQV